MRWYVKKNWLGDSSQDNILIRTFEDKENVKTYLTITTES